LKPRLLLFLILFVSLIFPLSAHSENEKEIKAVRKYLEPSFIFGAGGIHFGDNNKRWDDLVFEGEINNHLHWFNTGDFGFVLFNPKVKLRMYNEDSSLVKTPSFMPRLTYFCCHQ